MIPLTLIGCLAYGFGAAMPAEAQLFAPRPGLKPRTAFLATLGEIITTAAA
jgi:hypothetical protein